MLTRAGRPSEVIYPVRESTDGTRRRSSVWSITPGSSPEGRRNSILSFFGRKSSVSEAHAEVEGKKE